MSQRTLLQAVLERPSGAGPRMAFADGIAAADPARAEFIRVQVALAAPKRFPAAERKRLRQREAELRKAHADRWLAELPALPGITWGEQFRRGFVEHCQADSPEAFQANAAVLFGSAPLRVLSFRKLTDADAVRLAGMPELSKLRDLGLEDGELGDEGVRALAASPHLARLRCLGLMQNNFGPEGLLALARSPYLRSLRALDFQGNNHDTASLCELVLSPVVRHLRWLDAGIAGITSEAARAIADSTELSNLRSLNLHGANIGDAGLMYLAQSPNLPKLRELHLRGIDSGDAGLAVLLRSPLASRLRILDIESTDITNLGAWELVRSPRLERLRKLELWDCDNLLDPACMALRARFGKRVAVHIDDDDREEPNLTPDLAIFDAIREAPDDDAPRLVYADWLADHDDPERGDFIRVQCALAKAPADGPQRDELAHRERDLLKRNEERWTDQAILAWLEHPEELCPIAEPHDVCRIIADAWRLRLERSGPSLSPARKGAITRQLRKCAERLHPFNLAGNECLLPLFSRAVFHRGLLDTVSVPEIMFFLFAPAVRDLGVVRHLEVLLDESDDLDIGDRNIQRLVTTMDAPRLRTLSLHSYVTELESIEALAAWPGGAELTALLLFCGGDGDAMVGALARSPWLTNLRSLHIDLGEYSDAAIEAVLRSPTLAKLERLRLLSEDATLSAAVLGMYRARFGEGRPDAD